MIENNRKQNKIIAAIVAVILHALVLGVLFFIILPAVKIEEQGTVLVNIGDIDLSSGTFTPSPIEPVSTPPSAPARPSEPETQEAEELLTQEDTEAPVVTPPKKKVKEQPKPKPKPKQEVKKPQKVEKPVDTEAKRREEEARKAEELRRQESSKNNVVVRLSASLFRELSVPQSPRVVVAEIQGTDVKGLLMEMSPKVEVIKVSEDLGHSISPVVALPVVGLSDLLTRRKKKVT
ncbi:hypothetical protein [Porphyromonas cangingivalis]|uniref:hypothetical protein n=1 Tax=Porphyromonas cangingivalis TaxID=36874 RepID=UPI000688B62F|nr:hypothetical protein [Porphyromonas cangingivalis]